MYDNLLPHQQNGHYMFTDDFALFDTIIEVLYDSHAARQEQ